ncbi:hypothetical protein Patl1_31712 [Pistacia atlantica]|uniref:Uncharacterized protein n=1 Tax=Pistacia atlantica TaxID=434234 RepID=A0ACC1AMX3_9ROSI|nr:hypothetical protein Patl1_31712 [Pistacia atlantica]
MLLRQRLTTLTRQCRHLSTSSSSTKIPLLYTHTNDNQNDAVTLQLLVGERRLSRAVALKNLNPYLGDDPCSCVALGGVHSVALTSLGKISTCKMLFCLESIPIIDLKFGGMNLAGGVMVVLVHLDILSIIESCFLDWWKGNFTLGVEMKEMEGSGLGPWSSPNEEVDLVSLLRSKHYLYRGCCFLWWLFYNKAMRRKGNFGIGEFHNSGHHSLKSSNYELGRGDKVGGWRPKPIPSLEGVRIIQIASGGYHSLALTDEGKVLSWGYGGHGRVGSFFHRKSKVPVVIEALGDKHKGKLYMWGNAKDSQLGVPGLPEVQLCPVEVKFLTEDDGLGPHKVLSALGASHAMCLVSRSCC